MSMSTLHITEELERVCRIADMLCSGHAHLRDRYAYRALLLDLGILGLSSWLMALAFVEPRINAVLTPGGMDPQLWIGLIGFGTFLLTIIQLKTDWRGCADAHKRASDIYAEVKREARYLLASRADDNEALGKVLERYHMASTVGIAMPEKEFLREKRRHRIKVALSKHLDDHPFTFLPLIYIQLWFRDNFRRGRFSGVKPR